MISAIKEKRKAADRMKKDYAPTELVLGNLKVLLARHFGFCYGVENAIEIAFRAVAENPGKRIFLLSEMIHNPGVNADLQAAGVQFLMDTKGRMLMQWDDITPADVIIIPAFGTTVEIEDKIRSLGIDPEYYETTCPFVEKVWNRAEKIGAEGYTVVIHGKPTHEETRATFSHSRTAAPSVVVEHLADAVLLGKYIAGELPPEGFYTDFSGRYSEGFDAAKDLQRIGVVNQTTMLASDTQGIADYLKGVVAARYGTDAGHFADTRDTLCYATNDNQTAVAEMLVQPADFAIVIGGYNSSNTSHLVELCEEKLPTYFVNHTECLRPDRIAHFDLHSKAIVETSMAFPAGEPLTVMMTSGASCPDALVEQMLLKLAQLTGNAGALEGFVF